jgi:hypothetical protein
MKSEKEKTQPEKELEKIKSKPMSKELKAAIEKKLNYVNRDIKK